jgi:hypothetical protein
VGRLQIQCGKTVLSITVLLKHNIFEDFFYPVVTLLTILNNHPEEVHYKKDKSSMLPE